MEVHERFTRIDKRDVGFIPTFFSVGTTSHVVHTWKRKSVTIVSPNSGRILRQRSQPFCESGSDPAPKESGLIQRLFEDFKRAKVSDFSYQPSRVRKNSVYKPFCATKVAGKVEEESRATCVVIGNRRVVNEHLYFGSKVVEPEIQWTKASVVNREVVRPGGGKQSSVTLHSANRLRTPFNYGGSNMYMPTGEQLYWVCTVQFVLFSNKTILII